MPVVTVVVVPVDIVGIEVHVVRVVRVVRIEGRGPIVAVGADIVEIGVIPVASGGKEPPSAGRLTGSGVLPLTFSEEAPRWLPRTGRTSLNLPRTLPKAPFTVVTALRRDFALTRTAPSLTVV